MARTIFALFDDLTTAQRVADALEQEGYDRAGMSLLVPDARGEYGNAGGSFALTPLDVLGIGPAAVAGRLGAILSKMNGGSGGFVGSLTQLGFDGPDARHYFESIRRGQVLMAVESPEGRGRKTEEVMRRFGARAVEETPSIVSSEGGPAPASPRENMLDEVTFPVVEEQLEVQKRQVNRGGVRINSQVVEEPVQESVRLREERVNVERRAVNRDATEAELLEFKEGSIEIHETVEEPVISKRRRVVEEIVVGKELRERTETISETVRRTHVNVEQLAGERTDAPAAGRPDDRQVGDAGRRETAGRFPVRRDQDREAVREARGREAERAPAAERPEYRDDARETALRDNPVLPRPDRAESREGVRETRGVERGRAKSGERSYREAVREEGGLPELEAERAYRYGSALAGDERYRRSEWPEIEPHARRRWDEENEGTWEQFKDAVRHAWEKVSGR